VSLQNAHKMGQRVGSRRGSVPVRPQGECPRKMPQNGLTRRECPYDIPMISLYPEGSVPTEMALFALRIRSGFHPHRNLILRIICGLRTLRTYDPTLNVTNLDFALAPVDIAITLMIQYAAPNGKSLHTSTVCNLNQRCDMPIMRTYPRKWLIASQRNGMVKTNTTTPEGSMP